MLAVRNYNTITRNQEEGKNSNRRPYSYRHLQPIPVNTSTHYISSAEATENHNITSTSTKVNTKSTRNTSTSSMASDSRTGRSKKREVNNNMNKKSSSSSSSSSRSRSRSSRSKSKSKMKNTLRPIQTSNLNDSTNNHYNNDDHINEEHNHLLAPANNGSSTNHHITSSDSKELKRSKSSKKNHSRPQRSISPHARALLSRTFSRSRSRSRSSRSRSRSRSLSSRLIDEEEYHHPTNHTTQHHYEEDNDNASIGSSTSSSSSSSSSHHRSNSKQMLVAVLSCRSDAYITQKAPGSASMLPRKAPSALKTFHELAVGVKDAYESLGATPVKVEESRGGDEELNGVSRGELEGRKILFEFFGNLNFLLALVDEVATDSATRGALKDDIAFKNLRDVIKKCNKVLERMLIRRDNKYTLFFRLVQPHDTKDILKMQVWNQKVELAVTALSNNDEYNNGIDDHRNGSGVEHSSVRDDMSDVGSVTSESSRGSIMSRGRAMFRTAGRVRTRRATPTPRMRNKSARDGKSSFASMADDGYARSTPVTTANLNKLQLSFNNEDKASGRNPSSGISDLLQKKKQSQMSNSNNAGVDSSSNDNNNRMMLAPKDELVGMIRDLKHEKSGNENVSQFQHPSDIKPNWLPKADIPTTVPILPVEYIHRHRLMKQVVNSLINCSASDEQESKAHVITSITSRHADKAGNGKTTLAAAAVQSVEVRERFADGIAWIQLGRTPLSDSDIKRLYEELYHQLLEREIGLEGNNNISAHDRESSENSSAAVNGAVKPRLTIENSLSNNRRNFHGSDLQSIKEDLGRLLTKKRVLICLDDVWRLEDAERFIFEPLDNPNGDASNVYKKASANPYRYLITTRTPGLFNPDQANEVFVRIFSEHEAVKLLLYSAGRRLHGGKNAPAFSQARVIVKGCGNSPLALRLAGGMLRTSNRNWTLTSPVWTSLVDQCRASLEEASKIRSFVNSVGRIVDMSFMVVPDLKLRTSLRRCFVTFAVVFHDNDWLLTGKGIPKGIVQKLFHNVISRMKSESEHVEISADFVIDMLEHMNLLYRARHGTTQRNGRDSSSSTSSKNKSLLDGSFDPSQSVSEDEVDEVSAMEYSVVHVEHTSYLMHESIKYIADDMSSRQSTSFAPKDDEYTVFSEEIVVEEETGKNTKGQSWLSNAAKYLFSPLDNDASSDAVEKQFHELMVCVLKDNESLEEDGMRALNVEKYIVSYLPTHYIRAQMFDSASSLLLDFNFVEKRIKMFGALEATKRHMGDLTNLRQEVQKKSKENKENTRDMTSTELDQQNSSSSDSRTADSPSTQKDQIDVTRTQKEACRRVLDAVRRSEMQCSSSETSLDVAICLLIVAEFLLKSRIMRDAIARSEEALDLFQKILGNDHFEVARALNSLARACIKAGDERLALLKLKEAQQIYESCDGLRQHDAIANNALIATLLVENGDWENATLKYEEIISMKQEVYGTNSVNVAKTINDYAIVLAKHSRMSESLRQYEAARDVYVKINLYENFSFDITLIELNIASIKSKLGNYQGALESYERGVKGLRIQIEKEKSQSEGGGSRLAAQKRHLVSAMGRIGSMRMKLKNNAGALKAYLTLIKEVGKKSPAQSQMEKARAHVKCATIFRQTGTKENNALAISHLSQALQMYTILHGANHKDTKAIGSSLRQWQKIDASVDS